MGFEPEVVMVETLRRVMKGNENEAADVGEMWRQVSALIQSGRTFILSHHMKKPSPLGRTDARHRASGSTDILAGADDVLALERRGRDRFRVEHVKSRDGEETEPIIVSVFSDGSDGPVRLMLEGVESQALPIDKKTGIRDAILAHLGGLESHTSSKTDLIGVVATIGGSARTVERALEELCREDVLARITGQPGLYTLRHPPSPIKRDGDGGPPPPSPSSIHRPPASEPSSIPVAADDGSDLFDREIDYEQVERVRAANGSRRRPR